MTLTNKLYYNYRPGFFNIGRGKYTPSVIIGQQFSDYAGLIEIEDSQINEDRYTYKNANGMSNLTRFLTYSYVDGVDETGLMANIAEISSYCNLVVMTTEEAKEWLRARTSLEELNEGVFLINNSYTDEMGEFHEEELLVID